MERERQLEFVLIYFKFSRSLKFPGRDSSSAVQCLIIATGLHLLLFQCQAPLGLAYYVLGWFCTTVQNCWPFEEPSASASHSTAITAPAHAARTELQFLGMLLTFHCLHSERLHLAGVFFVENLSCFLCVLLIINYTGRCTVWNASQSTVCLSLTKHLESCVLSYIRGFGDGCLLFPEHFKWWCVSNGWYMKTRAGELQTRYVLVSTPGNFTLLIWKALSSQQPLPITTQPISPVHLAELLGSEWSSELLCSSTPFSWTSWAGKCWFCHYSIRNI